MKPLISLLQFTTILPLGKSQDIEMFARRVYLYPLAGYIIGILVGLPVFFIADRMIAAALAIAGIFILTGAHHFDGLLDFGDGLMAHGDRARKIQALTDRQIGAGGVASGIIVTLLLFAGLQASPSVVFAVIAGEVFAKFSMVVLTVYGIPFKEGIHSYLHQFSQPGHLVIAAALCLPLVFIPFAPLKLLGAAITAVVCPGLLLLVSKRSFGGVNGDVVGASNEITRVCVILALALF